MSSAELSAGRFEPDWRSGPRRADLAEQHAALRRVATLVARGVESADLFYAVADELARCLDVEHSCLFQYLSDGTANLVATRVPSMGVMPVGETYPLEPSTVMEIVFRTGQPARNDFYDKADGAAVQRMRGLGLLSAAGAPIVVDGQLWGVALVCSEQPRAFTDHTEQRLAEFADLVATAISNAETRQQLTASRARIVAAADDARRRLERDLHDGAQQRLVSLGLALRNAEAVVPQDQPELRSQITSVIDGLIRVTEDLQEISRGIHPAILSKGGLGRALQSLALRSAIPVTMKFDVCQPLPELLEVATYYVVSEALTNAAKHAQATSIDIIADIGEQVLHLRITDDGIGGADASKGSGLIGLIDRVEATGGRMTVVSPISQGTALHVTLPLPRAAD